MIRFNHYKFLDKAFLLHCASHFLRNTILHLCQLLVLLHSWLLMTGEVVELGPVLEENGEDPLTMCFGH